MLDRVTIERTYTNHWLGSGCVKIDNGTMEAGSVATIEFEYWSEALAFTRWYFMADAPSPESEARWNRLLEMATVYWGEDEGSYRRASDHKVESPASEEDLVREGILPDIPRYQVRQVRDYSEQDGPTMFWDVFDRKTGKPVVSRSTDAGGMEELADDLNAREQAASAA